MKTKPHQLNRPALAMNTDRCFISTSATTSPAFSGQKPKGANQLGHLRNHLAPLGFYFKNNDSRFAAFTAAASTRDIGPKTKGCHLPHKKVATFEKVGILSFLS